MSTAEVVSSQHPDSVSVKRPAVDVQSSPSAAKRPALEEPSEQSVVRIKRRKYALLLSYSGKGYYGLQRNPGTKTIEGDLLEALYQVKAISGEGLTQPQTFQFQRAARTDKGVSAIGQVLSARLKEDITVEPVNELLPPQIRLMGLKRVTKGFNSKMNCDARTYSYTMPSFALAPPQVLGIDVLPKQEPESVQKTVDDQDCDSSVPNEPCKVESSELDPSSTTTPSDSAVSAPPVSASPQSGEDVKLHCNDADEGPAIAEPPFDEETLGKMYAYRITPEIIKETNRILSLYLGTHNYHNFTSRRKAMDPSCQRYIIDFTCSDPVLYGDMEFVTIKIKGQSFMLHQIRKMVGLTIAIVSGLTKEETIAKAWEKNRLDIPIAPGLGLVLEEVHYTRYNRRYGGDGMHEEVDWSHLKDELNAFKSQFIMSNILETERAEHSMSSWLKGLRYHTFSVREDGKPSDPKPGTTNGYTSD